MHALSALLTPPASRRTAGYRSFPLVHRLERTALAAGFAVVVALTLAACGGANPHPARPPRTGMSQTPGIEHGMATFYGDEQGTATASGERFNKRQLTAAHRTLPFGTRVRVTNTRNGRSVEVRINDRGPFGKRDRIIDVSEAAARRLDMIDAGVVPVTIEIVR